MGSPRSRATSQSSFMSLSGSKILDENGNPIPLQDKTEQVYREISIAEIMKYYHPTWMAFVGLLASIAAAFQLPMFGYCLSQFVFVLSMDVGTHEEDIAFTQERDKWTWIFIALCFGIGLSTYVQKLCFGIGGENLTLTLRIKLFEAILRKHVGWFDDKNRAPGILSNVISEDINAVNGLSTESVGIMLEAALGLTISCIICAIFSWQLAIVVTLISPFMVLGGLGISKLQFNQKAVDDSYKQANALLSEIILNYRTVISLGDKNVDFILGRYTELLVVPHRAGIKRAHISGLFFGYSQSIRFAFVAFVFYIASVFVKDYIQTQ